MSQEKEDFIRSEVAVKVLQNLSSNEEGNYATSISEDLDKTQSSISRILTELKSKGMVSKGKRTKAQYYTVNYEGMTNYWYRKLEDHIKQSEAPPSSPGENYTFVNTFQGKESEIKDFTQKYFRRVIPEAEGINLYELLFTSFTLSLGFIQGSYTELEDKKFPDFLTATIQALISFQDLPYFGGQIFQILIMEE